MHEKFNFNQFDANVNKYDFQIDKYILPELTKVVFNPIKRKSILSPRNSVKVKHRTSTGRASNQAKSMRASLKEKRREEILGSDLKFEVLEPFKKTPMYTKPSICAWEFMTEKEILETKKIKKISKLKELIDVKLNKSPLKGLPKRLLNELFVSIIKFARKCDLEPVQIGALLTIFYNTHMYVSHNLWVTTETVYKFFKEFLIFNSINLPPYQRKIFEVNECKKIAMYFCSVYLRNLPLIRLLMLPNYGLLLSTVEEPRESIEDNKRKKGKKTDKKKKK